MNDVAALLAGARQGRIAHIARLLSIVENEEPEAADIVRSTYAETGRAIVIGFTGPPGSGKSTLVSAMTALYRQTAARVAVVAVDPSSPYTGGAILGDRIRMRDRFLDTGVFIRVERTGRPEDLRQFGSLGNMTISAISVSELLAGVLNANTPERQRRRQASTQRAAGADEETVLACR